MNTVTMTTRLALVLAAVLELAQLLAPLAPLVITSAAMQLSAQGALDLQSMSTESTSMAQG
jgi:hypothetical protein